MPTETAYVDVADIGKELSFDISEMTTPSSESVLAFIGEMEADVNGVIASYNITVPLEREVSPDSFAMVKQAIIFGVCARVLGAHVGIAIGEAPKEAFFWERYRLFLKRFLDRPAILHDAIFKTTKRRVSFIVEGDPDYHERNFTMGTKF